VNERTDGIPELYATEHIPLEKKVIYRRYRIREIGFYWLIAELDKDRKLAFGYANLNNDDFAEWGYISLDELLDNGAEQDMTWKPCTYKDAMNRIAEERMKAEKRWENRWRR
jgi:hypothetical protein